MKNHFLILKIVPLNPLRKSLTFLPQTASRCLPLLNRLQSSVTS